MDNVTTTGGMSDAQCAQIEELINETARKKYAPRDRGAEQHRLARIGGLRDAVRVLGYAVSWNAMRQRYELVYQPGR